MRSVAGVLCQRVDEFSRKSGQRCVRSTPDGSAHAIVGLATARRIERQRTSISQLRTELQDGALFKFGQSTNFPTESVNSWISQLTGHVPGSTVCANSDTAGQLERRIACADSGSRLALKALVLNCGARRTTLSNSATVVHTSFLNSFEFRPSTISSRATLTAARNATPPTCA